VASCLDNPVLFCQIGVVEETNHFKEMLEERAIRRDWVAETLSSPDRAEQLGDGTKHYFKCIHENGNRWLKVVVNEVDDPPRLVTVYFDRTARRRYENQSG